MAVPVPRDRCRLRRAGWVVVVAVVAGASAVAIVEARDGGGRRAPTAAASPHLAARQDLCTARDRARTGDRDGAAAAFTDAHGALHDLAAAAAATDRPAAARLLEAKSEVEADLATSAPPATLAADLERLVATAGTAAVATGLPAPAPC